MKNSIKEQDTARADSYLKEQMVHGPSAMVFFALADVLKEIANYEKTNGEISKDLTAVSHSAIKILFQTRRFLVEPL